MPLLRRAIFIVVGTVFPMFLHQIFPQRAVAITITMEYTDEGDPVPHDENPSWDPAGLILKQHFNRAKQIWESLLPGPGDFEFDFHWDNDIPGLGLATNVGFIDTYIEINPNYAWFADATLLTDEEFNPVGIQKLYSDLTPTEQNNFFVGSPPGALETHYQRDGLGTYVGAGGYNSSDGYDLLTVVLHEIGHVLGISSPPPQVDPLYPLNPAHVGGAGVIVVGDEGHLAGSSHTPGYLMCGECANPDGRYYPTATDVLAIAEANGITDVYLQRVGRISSGLWDETNSWIGGDTPGFPQDVYVTHGGAVTLAANASAKDLLVATGSTVSVGSNALNLGGNLTIEAGSTVSVGTGGTISAQKITRFSNDITTAPGSLVWFNDYIDFTGDGGPTADFNGSVRIGNNGNSSPLYTFNPSTITEWTIAEELAIDSGNGQISMVIDGEADFTSASGRVGPANGVGAAPFVTIDGISASWNVDGLLAIPLGNITVTNNADLEANSSTIGSEYGRSTVIVQEGISRFHVVNNLEVGPTVLVGDGQGTLILRADGRASVGGNVNIHGTSTRTSEISVESDGDLEVDGAINVGPYGLLTYRDATFGFSGIIGSQTINNLGGANNGTGGVTRFVNTSIAGRNSDPGTIHFTNHPGTTFFAAGGSSEFRDTASAGNARFDNLPGVVSIYSGTTRFFDSATAADGQFFNHPGNWTIAPTVEFNGNSTGGNGTFVNLPGVLGVSLGGALVFNNFSNAGTGTYTSQGEGGSVVFNHNASADHGTFSTDDNIGGNSTIRFNDDATAANATISMGANTGLNFFQRSSAGDATITLRQNGRASFSGDFNIPRNPTTTAGTADITVEGASVPGGFGGRADFSTYSTAGDAVINTYGGTVAGAYGGTTRFDYEGRAGNATLIAHGPGVPSAAGGQIEFARGANGDNAKVITLAGGVFNISGNYFYNVTTTGSIEGGGTYVLGGAELETGSRNTDTTVSGQIVDPQGSNPGGRLTKVGTGTLTLSGINTYSGLTKVNGGAIAVNGSIAGNAQVNSGGTLKGTGTIGGTITVNAGGVLAPGASPESLSVGALMMMPGSMIAMEIGGTTPASQYDQLLATGAVAFDGTLAVSLINGFSPNVGDTFNLFDGTISGAFDVLNLPSLTSGRSWSTSQLYTSGVLSVVAGQAGDFDNDGDVDGRDFLVWQRNPSLGNLGDWQANYGVGALSASTAVPEPSAFVLVLLGGYPLSRKRLDIRRR
jgi:autotransporter-associated beta strand protein